MSDLHRRGMVLIVELLEAAARIGRSNPEIAALLRETAEVVDDLLKQDAPPRLSLIHI